MSRHHDDRAARVAHHLVADRAHHQPREPATPSGAHHQQVGIACNEPDRQSCLVSLLAGADRTECPAAPGPSALQRLGSAAGEHRWPAGAGEGAEVVALLQQRIHGRLRGPESDPHHLIRVMPAKGNRPAGFRLPSWREGSPGGKGQPHPQGGAGRPDTLRRTPTTPGLRPGGRKSRAPGTFVSIPDALMGHVLGQEVRACLRGSHRGNAA